MPKCLISFGCLHHLDQISFTTLIPQKSFSTDIIERDRDEDFSVKNDVGTFNDVYNERRLTERHTVFIVHNELQSASCVQFYFDCSNSSFAILELFAHLVRLQIIEHIKQVMSLGYVVNCDVRKVGDGHGLRIIVRSQYPFFVVYTTVENAVSAVDDFLAAILEETFEQSRSVQT